MAIGNGDEVSDAKELIMVNLVINALEFARYKRKTLPADKDWKKYPTIVQYIMYSEKHCAQQGVTTDNGKLVKFKRFIPPEEGNARMVIPLDLGSENPTYEQVFELFGLSYQQT